MIKKTVYLNISSSTIPLYSIPLDTKNIENNIYFKLNSNPYHYKLKFPSTSKEKFNSKFQEFEAVRILKKATKFGPKNITQILVKQKNTDY